MDSSSERLRKIRNEREAELGRPLTQKERLAITKANDPVLYREIRAMNRQPLIDDVKTVVGIGLIVFLVIAIIVSVVI